MGLVERVTRERDLHNEGLNRRLIDRLQKHVWGGPSERRRAAALHDLMAEQAGKKVLEIGSSAWESWIDLDRGFPAELHCLNISEVELEKGKLLAKEKKVDDKVVFHLMDAHKLTFPDSSFDCVYGGAIFHHLDCNVAFAEVARVLKPGGRFILAEPMGMNPAGKLVRWATPQARTPDEKPFDLTEFRLLREHFVIENWMVYDFFSIPFAFLSSALFKKPDNLVNRFGCWFDRMLFAALPPSRYWANHVLFVSRKK